MDTMHSNINNDHKIWFMTVSWFSSSSSPSSKCSPGRLHKQKRRLVVRSDSLGNPHVRQGATARGRRRGKGEMFDRNLKAQGAEVQNQDIKALKSSNWKALWSKTSKAKAPQSELGQTETQMPKCYSKELKDKFGMVVKSKSYQQRPCTF